jgi:hypothetical protein
MQVIDEMDLGYMDGEMVQKLVQKLALKPVEVRWPVLTGRISYSKWLGILCCQNTFVHGLVVLALPALILTPDESALENYTALLLE